MKFTMFTKFTLRLFEPCGVNIVNFVNLPEHVSGIFAGASRDHLITWID